MVKLTIVGNEIETTRELYKKADTIPFDIPNYTHLLSCVPVRSLYATIHSQFTMNTYMVDNIEAFEKACKKVVAKLVANKLSHRRILRVARAWFKETLVYLPTTLDQEDVQDIIMSL